jgi:hypothetical protein
MKLTLTTQPIDKVEAETIILMHYSGDVPFQGMAGLVDWRLNGRLSRVVQSGRFDGRAKDLLLMPAEGRFQAQEVIFLGMGGKESFGDIHIPQVVDYLIEVIAKKRTAQVCFSLNQMLSFPFEWRNVVRLLVAKLLNERALKEVILCEPEECIRDAKKRKLELGPGVQVNFD